MVLFCCPPLNWILNISERVHFSAKGWWYWVGPVQKRVYRVQRFVGA